MNTIEFMKSKNINKLTTQDIEDVFYDLIASASEHYDNALLNLSFERDNINEITVIKDILYNLPNDYTYDLNNLEEIDNEK